MARRIAELTPNELKFCRLRAQGYAQTQAYRQAFNKPRMKAKSATEAASRLAAKPQVLAMLRDLFREAKKSSLLSHAEYLDRVKRDWEHAREVGNLTAAASFARLAGQAIGTLAETLRVEETRLTDEQLLDKLGSYDSVLRERLELLIGAKASFH